MSSYNQSIEVYLNCLQLIQFRKLKFHIGSGPLTKSYSTFSVANVIPELSWTRIANRLRTD